MSQTAIAPLPVRSAPAAAEPRPQRLVSIDAYRGLVMLLMVGEVLALAEVATHFPHSAVWKLIAYHTTHVQWFGCSLHDMIQPSFSFLVGVAVPFSIASRKSRGHGFWRMFIHAIWRALLLIALGIFLRSVYSPVVKRIWTPAWTIYSGGICALMLAGFYTLTDWPGIRFWAMPLAIIGMNSIAMYVLADIGFFKPFITRSIKTHLGQNIFMHWGPTWAPLAEGACILAVFWLIALWMYRRKLFIRI